MKMRTKTGAEDCFRKRRASRILSGSHTLIARIFADCRKVAGAARPASPANPGQTGPASDLVSHLYTTLNAPSLLINTRLTGDSLDSLGLIKRAEKCSSSLNEAYGISP